MERKRVLMLRWLQTSLYIYYLLFTAIRVS